MLIFNPMQDLDPSDICKKKFLNPLKRIRVIIRTPTQGRMDGRTDRQTDRRTNRVNPVYPPATKYNKPQTHKYDWYQWCSHAPQLLFYNSVRIHIIRIRLPQDSLVFMMGIHILSDNIFILKQAPCYLRKNKILLHKCDTDLSKLELIVIKLG